MGRLRRLEKAVFHDSYSIVSEETVLRSPSQRLDKLVCRRATGRQMSSHVFLQRTSTSVRRLEKFLHFWKVLPLKQGLFGKSET